MTAKKREEDLLKVGAPTKYKPEYCKMLIDHLASGLKYESFAGVVGVDRNTIYRWEELFPEFGDAKREGFSKGYLFWDKVSTSVATGRSMKYKDIEGKTQTISPKDIPQAIYIFNMKNRFGWKDKTEVDHTSSDKSMSPDKQLDLSGLSLEELKELKRIQEKLIAPKSNDIK